MGEYEYEYDYVIVGGGPSGLTCALYLSSLENYRVLLIDKNPSLGGCHRVIRVGEENYFTEHGPRMYSSAYVNLKTVLQRINLSFDDVFVKSNFDLKNNLYKSIKIFSLREIFILALQFMKMTLYGCGENLKYTSVKNFADNYNFSEEAKDYMNRMCRLTDGAGSDRYSMHEFMNLFNQNFFYSLYQPKHPNDEYLFKLWETALLKSNVTILKNTECISVQNNYIETQSNHLIKYNKLILCLPPRPFLKLVNNSQVNGNPMRNLFSTKENLDTWVEDNSYNKIISVTYHWTNKIDLPQIWGSPKDDWGIAFIVLTDYMNAEPTSKLVISVCITFQNSKSSFTGKTAFESNEEELVAEIFRQLKISFPKLPFYSKAIINPTVTYDKNNNKWHEEDTAYSITDKQDFIDFKSNDPNIFFVGTQNGNSYYSFTSMESAISNALYALRQIEPKLKHSIEIKNSIDLVLIVRVFFFVLFILVVIAIFFSYVINK